MGDDSDAVCTIVNIKKKAKIAFVICVVLFVFGCFCIPIVIYATSSDITPIKELGIEFDIDTCTQQVSYM